MWTPQSADALQVAASPGGCSVDPTQPQEHTARTPDAPAAADPVCPRSDANIPPSYWRQGSLTRNVRIA
ncbi:hypothetical protein GCM10009539_24380 [Cryptosporangium japonicum]|uniref:Uncharacterized protein n=1 Tax=Cryptosporangium japonicum TaxID=80872 RepID=A0ABN0U4W7_9ACTN